MSSHSNTFCLLCTCSMCLALFNGEDALQTQLEPQPEFTNIMLGPIKISLTASSNNPSPIVITGPSQAVAYGQPAGFRPFPLQCLCDSEPIRGMLSQSNFSTFGEAVAEDGLHYSSIFSEDLHAATPWMPGQVDEIAQSRSPTITTKSFLSTPSPKIDATQKSTAPFIVMPPVKYKQCRDCSSRKKRCPRHISLKKVKRIGPGKACSWCKKEAKRCFGGVPCARCKKHDRACLGNSTYPTVINSLCNNLSDSDDKIAWKAHRQLYHIIAKLCGERRHEVDHYWKYLMEHSGTQDIDDINSPIDWLHSYYRSRLISTCETSNSISIQN